MLEIVVADNGIGFDSRRYDAFCTTDTDHKISRGGKGIGRLLWLDAFEAVSVDSIFREDEDRLRRRRFSFVLAQSDQIVSEIVEDIRGYPRQSRDWHNHHIPRPARNRLP
jgi:hypothetical protein